MPPQLTLTLPPNVLHTQSQQLTIEKVATLIGGNGSGKSCILKSVFDQKLSATAFEQLRIVSFSSGQNENFSSAFAKYLTRQRRAGNELNLDCFHFDKSWSKLLIFLAIGLKQQGRVRTFLSENSYIAEDSSENSSAQTTLSLKFKVDQQYVDLIQAALKEEESGITIETLRTTPFHLGLESFIQHCVQSDYAFEEPVRKTTIQLNTSQLNQVTYPIRPTEQDEQLGTPALPSVHPALSFFIKAADNAYFLDQATAQLTFPNGLELDQLSDGEYQLLFLYAILDLLDSEQTLFLLDEADSHLHYANVNALWCLLKQIKGRSITTTHLLDSITSNDHNSLHVIENGRIAPGNKLKTLIERLRVLSKAKNVEYEICARLPHLALMDDYNDWDIFIRLAQRKGLDISQVESVCAFKKTSSYTTNNDDFGEPKLDWTRELSRADDCIVTSQIFLICDCDAAALQFKTDGVQVAGRVYQEAIHSLRWPNNQRVDVYLLAWKRREIKNYLLSHTALSHHNALDKINNGRIGADDHLKANDPGDNDSIRRLRAKDAVDPLINSTDGLCSQTLQDYIDLIPPTEISEDIEKMFHFIKAKLS